jgi:TolA-binding protein
MDAFLARWPSSERLNDVHFLQAQVHAQRGDCAVALPLFVGLLGDPGHGDDALYLTAYCEQALSRQAAARTHLQQYLQRFPGGKHQAEAKAALRKR